MKLIYNTLRLFIASVVLWLTAPAATATETPFEYPVAPDSIESFQERTSYVMTHFWDKADFKKLAADTAALRVAVADFIDFVPYAHADTVRHSIQHFLSHYAGQPATLLHIVRTAEASLVGPDADFWSEPTYMLFLRQVLADKKVKSKDKEPLMAQIKKFNSSSPGTIIQNFDYTTRHGARHNLYEQSAPVKILLLEPADCSDCSLNRLRLQADIATGQLVKDNQLKILLIRPGKQDKAWDSAMESLPFQWEVGSSENISDLVDTRRLPYNYILDADNKILMRNLTVDQILNLTASLYREK